MAQTLAELIAARFGVDGGTDGGAKAKTLRAAGGGMAGEDAVARILARRTHREYAAREIPDGLLRVLLACAQSASSKSDLQAMSVVVVKKPETREAIAALLPAMPWVAEAPVFLVFLGDMRRNQRVCARYGRPHDNNTLDTFFNVSVDAALAMQTFILAAEAAGLGCCPISHIRDHMETITEQLRLPAGVFPVAGLCVGYPADKPPLAIRLPPALVVHTDRYDDSAFEQELERYDRRRHARAPLPPEKQKGLRKYGSTDYCPWSDNVSRQLSLRERPGFADFLRGHGFDLK